MKVNLKEFKVRDLAPGSHIEIPKDDRDFLKKSISEMGVLLPIVVHQGKVVDGNNRLILAKELGIDTLPGIEVDESPNHLDPELLALHINVARRHMTREQKIQLIEKLVEIEAKKAHERKVSGKTHPDEKGKTVEKVAKMVGVSPTTVQKVLKIKKTAPDIYQKVLSGELSVEKGYKEVEGQKLFQEEKDRNDKTDIEISSEQSETEDVAEIEKKDKEIRALVREMKEIMFSPLITHSEVSAFVIHSVDLLEKALLSMEIFSIEDRRKIELRVRQFLDKWGNQFPQEGENI